MFKETLWKIKVYTKYLLIGIPTMLVTDAWKGTLAVLEQLSKPISMAALLTALGLILRNTPNQKIASATSLTSAVLLLAWWVWKSGNPVRWERERQRKKILKKLEKEANK